MKYNTIIIGGGVAGLTAGMYLARANISTLILESKYWGGQTALLNKVSNYPAIPATSGFEISNNLYQQVSEFKVDMKIENVVKLSRGKEYIVETNKNKYYAKNIIIATGATTTTLGLKEEKQFLGKGVSYCATCDGNFFKDQPVAVYGVGKTALEDVKYLSNVASEVCWILPDKHLKQNIADEIKSLTNVRIKSCCNIVELGGDVGLEQIKLYNKQAKTLEKLYVKGLFVALGRRPDLSWLEVDVKTNRHGYIAVDKHCRTTDKNIYACGDITSRELKQIVTACSDGAIASSYIIAKGQNPGGNRI